jgi:hypothetical protein
VALERIDPQVIDETQTVYEETYVGAHQDSASGQEEIEAATFYPVRFFQ